MIRPGVVLAFALTGATVCAECPSAEEILARLQEAPVDAGSRGTRFGEPAPDGLYEKAVARQDRAFAVQRGHRAQAVAVVDLDVTELWMAVNDELNHADEERYLPILESTVIQGEAGRGERLVFQYFRRHGVQRWWVNRMRPNPELYREHGLWEIFWEDATHDVDPDQPPINEVSGDMSPMVDSHGTWLLVPLGEGCTWLEHYNRTHPGGFAGTLQPMFGASEVRRTVEGVIRLARDRDHDPAEFVRPDGTPLREKGRGGSP